MPPHPTTTQVCTANHQRITRLRAREALGIHEWSDLERSHAAPMGALMLVITMLAAEEPTVTAPAPDEWPQEHRRVHFGAGVRVHGGVLASGLYPLYLLQTEVFGSLNIRLWAHEELRVQLGFSGGWPDMWGGETNVSFHHALTERVSIGFGGFAYLGPWSLRAGLELPIVIRSSSRRHQLLLGIRLHTGVFNTVPLPAWQANNQRATAAGDVAVGYVFQL
ncbi:MAG: hypothetical protein JNK82_27155 [Myxococcaceae bacterium]|nr:hypothetical protein [Myxococcaceae bacterium]